jgi:DNA-binding CsgD family transcriptional regulator
MDPIVSAILVIVGSVALNFLSSELLDFAPKLAERLVRLAAAALPPQLRSRYLEEWLAHLDDTPGRLTKVFQAAGFMIATTRLRGRHLMKSDAPDETSNTEAARSNLLKEGMLKPADDVIYPAAGRLKPRLTRRELEVLRWSAEGKSADDIASILGLSIFASQEHQRALRSKYGATKMTQVLVLAALDGTLSVARK